MMAYAASVGSAAAKREVGAIGFVGNATDATAHYFGNDKGRGHHAARADRLCRLDACARPRCSARPSPTSR